MADTTFGRIQNALMSATNELTVAAANINFEFTMVKYEAPPEYQPLSQTLSSFRRNEAEGGEIHITARRLGALFEGVCPRTPNLINAYGTRASEIASQAAATGAPNSSNWIFSAYVGVDTTSLWAAATSRKAALPVHLLACMLARIWDAAEAISLWVEIVAERRAEIAARFESGDEMPFMQTAAAVQPEITREQLAKWDASARAWLRTADVIQTHQYKQFLLIIKNISLPVNGEASTYRSAMLAWVSALETMEGLLLGGPHVVRDGAVLLALSAWHLYPDMVAYGGKKSIEVFMKDSLVHSGGVLSLGISDSDMRQSKGVYWSLSLAHHKFYGRPVVKTVQVTPDGSRMTFLELQQAVIGVILAHWNIPVSQTNDALRFLLQITASLNYNDTSWEDRWVKMITVPIMEHFRDEEHGAVLLALGRRRRDFIKSPAEGDKLEFPYFGLFQMANLIPLVSTIGARLELLRRLARRVKDIDQAATLIALKDGDSWIYATESTSSSRHRGASPVMAGPVTRSRNKMAKSARQPSRRWVPMRAAMSNASTLQEVMQFDEGEFEHRGRTLIRHIRTDRMFEFVFGDADVAAFFREQDLDVFSSIIPPTIEPDDVRWCFQHDLISPQDMRAVMMSSQRSPIISALRILAQASSLYSNLAQEGATISTAILSYPLAPDLVDRYTSNLSVRKKGQQEYRLRLEAAMIAYLETGRYMVSPEDLSEGTLGLSVGDSISVPTKVSKQHPYLFLVAMTDNKSVLGSPRSFHPDFNSFVGFVQSASR